LPPMTSNSQREPRSSSGRSQVLPIGDVIGNIPPHSTDAEVAVIGAMLVDKEAVSKVVEVLDADCFYHDKHILIFKAMMAMFERGVTIDLVSLTDQLQREGSLDRVGGMFALTEISIRTVSAANVEHHARIVLERYLKRQLIKVASDIIGNCYDDTTDALDEVDRAEQRIFEVAEKRLRRSYSGMKKLTTDAIEKIMAMRDGDGDGVTGVPTGFTQLDQLLSGLQPSDLIIVAARPSMGKTAFALSIAREASRRGKAVGLFSLEMSAQQLVLRLISADAQVGLQNLRSGRLSDVQMHEVLTRVDNLMKAPIFIDDSAALSPVEFRAKCRRMKMEHKIDVIIVDYLQLMHAPKAESREREISVISHTLKAVAKEMQVPIIALSQLNRTLESRADKRPMLSDLRESGSIEQDADVVMFIHRPEYYKIATFEDGRSTENIAEIIVGKQRNGPTGDIRLFYQKELAAFHDLAIHRDAFDVSPQTGLLQPGDAPF